MNAIGVLGYLQAPRGAQPPLHEAGVLRDRSDPLQISYVDF